jgi:hypothetical protein
LHCLGNDLKYSGDKDHTQMHWFAPLEVAAATGLAALLPALLGSAFTGEP